MAWSTCWRRAQPDDWVLVHDAARCLVTPAQIDALIDACLPDAVGGLLALPLADTLKHAGPMARGCHHGPRGKWLAQTPQMFRIGALRDALAHAASDFAGITDEASAMEAAGPAPLLVRGSAQNFKVTYPEDFALAEAILNSGACTAMKQPCPLSASAKAGTCTPWCPAAAGDRRRAIPHTHGLLGHSDADVLLHAITDALLGAAGLGDIGTHFPDTDAAFKGADSPPVLLAEAARRVRERRLAHGQRGQHRHRAGAAPGAAHRAPCARASPTALGM
jgi:2-C-methyl-D-erythritol 4-phosphate cytidylyltransferase/2-C-methyl-D-erythritol 2,4-cyclodiphosphate synthase